MRNIIFFWVLVAVSSAGLVQVDYSLSDLGSGRWKYDYTIANQGLPSAVKALTLWYDSSLYSDLVIESSAAAAADWDQLILQAVPGKGYGFDLWAKTQGIESGSSYQGLSVSFLWNGVESPSAQLFEVFDPATYQVLVSDITIPEPCTSLLLAAGFGCLMARRKTA